MNFFKFLILFICINNCIAMDTEIDDPMHFPSADVSFEQTRELAQKAFKDKNVRGIICYAWHDDPNHRGNTLPKRIADTLQDCGVNMHIDVRDLNVGDSIETYIQKISDPNYFVIFIITPLAAERCAINESDLKLDQQLPWIKKEVLRIADRLNTGNPIIPLILGHSDADTKAHAFFTDFFNNHIKTKKPNHTPKEYLYISFADDSRFYSNIVEIINRRLLMDTKPQSLIKIKRGYHNKRSIALYVYDFFVDYVEPNVVPTLAVCAALYFGIYNFRTSIGV